MAARKWTQTVGNLWSTAANWDGSLTVPQAGDTVTFDATSTAACTVDNIGAFNGTITVAAAYTNTITQSAAVSGIGTLAISGGIWNAAGFGLATTGNANITVASGKQLQLGSTSVVSMGTGTMTVTGTLTYSGALTITGSLTTASGSTVTGSSSPSLTINQSLTLNSTSTWTSVNVLCNGTTATTYTDTGAKNSGVWTLNKSSSVTIAASTIMDIGTNPTVTLTASSLVVTGTLTFAGNFIFSSNNGFNVGAAGTVTGTGTPTLVRQLGSITLTAGATWPATMPILFTASTGTQSITAPANTLGTVTVMQTGSANFTVAASTSISLDANPTSACGTTGTFTVTGTVSFSGTWTHTSALTATGTVTGTSTPVINVTEGAVNFTSVTFTNPLRVTMTQTSATSRTFTGGAKTYTTFTRNGSGSGTLIIASSNTFTTFQDNAGLAAHTLTFTAGTTQTAGTFSLGGSSGKLLTINSSSSGSAATLHTTGGVNIDAVFTSIKDSTVDVSPIWYYGEGSSLVSGNTNWISGSDAGSAGSAIILRRRRR